MEDGDVRELRSEIRIRDGEEPLIQIWKNGELMELDGLAELGGLAELVDIEEIIEDDLLEAIEGLPFEVDIEVLVDGMDLDDDCCGECDGEGCCDDCDEDECCGDEECCDEEECEEEECEEEEEGGRGRFVILKERFNGDGETFAINRLPGNTGARTYSRGHVQFALPRMTVGGGTQQDATGGNSQLVRYRFPATPATPTTHDELMQLAVEIQAELRAMRSELNSLRAELGQSSAPAPATRSGIYFVAPTTPAVAGSPVAPSAPIAVGGPATPSAPPVVRGGGIAAGVPVAPGIPAPSAPVAASPGAPAVPTPSSGAPSAPSAPRVVGGSRFPGAPPAPSAPRRGRYLERR